MEELKTKIARVGAERYIDTAKNKMEKSDYLGALGFLYTALGIERSFVCYKLLAESYNALFEYETSNKFWYLYLDSCPKNQVATAYEGLSANFVAQNDLLHAGYYFNLLLAEDGTKLQSELGVEFAESYVQATDPKSQFYLAYPSEKANYKRLEDKAKSAYLTGDFQTAVATYKMIPPERLSNDAIENLSMCCYVMQDLQTAIDICRDIVKVKPNNLTALSNLCSIYNLKREREKAVYYYQLAKQNYTGSEEDNYKIVDCAIEQADDAFVVEILQKLTVDNPNQSSLLFPYGIALSNLGFFERAERCFSRICKLFPYDETYAFYAKYVQKINLTGKDEQQLLPFKYKKEIPPKLATEYKARIKELFSDLNKINTNKRNENLKVLKWGLTQESHVICNDSILALSSCGLPQARKILLDTLMDVEVSAEVKEKIVFSLILSGYRGKIHVVAGRFYVKLKGAKLPFDDKPNGTLFVQGYAFALSKLMFWNIDNVNRLVISANKVYNALNFDAEQMQLDQREVAAVIISVSDIQKITQHINVSAMLGVDADKIKNLIKLVKGDNNDKNN